MPPLGAVVLHLGALTYLLTLVIRLGDLVTELSDVSVDLVRRRRQYLRGTSSFSRREHQGTAGTMYSVSSGTTMTTLAALRTRFLLLRSTHCDPQ